MTGVQCRALMNRQVSVEERLRRIDQSTGSFTMRCFALALGDWVAFVVGEMDPVNMCLCCSLQVAKVEDDLEYTSVPVDKIVHVVNAVPSRFVVVGL